MKSKTSRVGIAAVACVIGMLGLTLLAPASMMTSSAAADPVRIKVGAAQEPDTLNPFKMVLSMSYTINFLVYDTLTSVDKDLEFGPQLASSWDVSPDGLTWTFHLVENAVWHDGEPVTAHDVEFTFDLILDNPTEGALWIDYLPGVDSSGVTATDTYTVEIVTDEPKATMLSIMIPILPEHVWSEIPAKDIDKVDPWNEDYFPNGPIGSGPFKLESWDSTLGDILLLKNPDYFMGEVNVDELLFKTFGDESSMTLALYGDELDVATWVPASLWEDTLEKDGIEGQEVNSLSFYELGINCATEEWREAFQSASDNLETTNISVRQAIAMATDKDDIVNRILEGLAEPGVSIIPKATDFWFYELSEGERWDYQIEAANDLLDACGYGADEDMDGIRENETSGVELDFSLYYRKDYLDEDRSARAIRTSLGEIGINARLEPVSEGVLWNTWMGCEYDLFIWGWDCDVDPNFMLSTMTTAQQPVDSHDSTKWGDAFWCNDEYDQMYLDQQNAIVPEERQAIIHDMQAMLYHHCPYVVLYYPMGLYAYSTSRFTDFPDMENHAGLVPESMWFYFEITPISGEEETYPPENVDAGPDRHCSVNETLYFSGFAEDQDTEPEDLNWTWTFAEPDTTMETRYGRSVYYNFTQMGNVTVSLIVKDPELNVGSDSLTVNVTELSETQGWLRGYVTDDAANPLEGALVDAGTNSRMTDPEGYYSMVLEVGNYSVDASKGGYGAASADVEVVAGEIAWSNFTLSLTSGTLEVWVYDSETEEPIPSAAVKIVYGTTTKNHTTNSDGFYVFEAVDIGTVTVNVTKTGYEYNATVAEVTVGNTTVLEVYLDPVKEEGSSSLGMIALAALLIVVVVAGVAFYMLKRKGGEKEPTMDDASQPEQP